MSTLSWRSCWAGYFWIGRCRYGSGDGLKDFDVDEEEGDVAGKNMTENH